MYEPTKEPSAKKTIFKGSSFILTMTIPADRTQITAITPCKIAPNHFLPLATTIKRKVPRVVSIIFRTNIRKYVVKSIVINPLYIL